MAVEFILYDGKINHKIVLEKYNVTTEEILKQVMGYYKRKLEINKIEINDENINFLYKSADIEVGVHILKSTQDL